jgi:alpha-tubulin suppressor-like RCC1 family protein
VTRTVLAAVVAAWSFCACDRAPGPERVPSSRPSSSESAAPSTSVASPPAASPPTPPPRLVSGGHYHACAIDTKGRLFCYGDASDGRLGNGSDLGGRQAVKHGESATWRAVASGFLHSCGIDSTATLYCWGRNQGGQLGRGALGNDPRRPRALGGSWKDIDTGEVHSCGIDEDGRLWCWGENRVGELGVSSDAPCSAPRGCQPTPKRVGAASDWRAVAAGAHFTCGLRADASLWCWGAGTRGQLGQAGASSSDEPRPVEGRWRAVSAGGDHACAIDTEDHLFCWGSGQAGQLGFEASDTCPARPTSACALGPRQVGEDRWRTVSAGGYHTCGIKRDGSIWCWGDNSYGAVGGDVFEDRPRPLLVGNKEKGWRAVGAGYRHTCALDGSGHLACWGVGLHPRRVTVPKPPLTTPPKTISVPTES